MATNPQARMTRLTARIDAAMLAAFDAFAEARGGRSAVLRQLIEKAMEANGAAPRIERPDGTLSNRISLRFTDTENAVIAYRASQRSTDRSRWIKALVRRHIGLKGRVDDGLLAELAPIRMQLLRIGRNLNQAMKAANASMAVAANSVVGVADLLDARRHRSRQSPGSRPRAGPRRTERQSRLCPGPPYRYAAPPRPSCCPGRGA